jgi:hypothetical protein
MSPNNCVDEHGADDSKKVTNCSDHRAITDGGLDLSWLKAACPRDEIARPAMPLLIELAEAFDSFALALSQKGGAEQITAATAVGTALTKLEALCPKENSKTVPACPPNFGYPDKCGDCPQHQICEDATNKKCSDCGGLVVFEGCCFEGCCDKFRCEGCGKKSTAEYDG